MIIIFFLFDCIIIIQKFQNQQKAFSTFKLKVLTIIFHYWNKANFSENPEKPD